MEGRKLRYVDLAVVCVVYDNAQDALRHARSEASEHLLVEDGRRRARDVERIAERARAREDAVERGHHLVDAVGAALAFAFSRVLKDAGEFQCFKTQTFAFPCILREAGKFQGFKTMPFAFSCGLRNAGEFQCFQTPTFAFREF